MAYMATITCPHCGKNIDVSEISRQLGAKGALTRSKNLTAERRKEIARLSAQARWKNHKKKE